MTDIQTPLPDLRCQLGEGPFWDQPTQTLYWVDIIGKAAFAWKPAQNDFQKWTFDSLISAIVPRQQGGFLVALHNELAFFDPETGKVTPFVAPDGDHAQNRSNEARVDPAGRFWLGTMQNNIGPNGEAVEIIEHSGTLNRVDADGTITRFGDNIGISNTMLWSHDGTKMYFGDTLANRMDVYDFDMTSGTPSNPQLFCSVEGRGGMDGSAMDCDGFIWNARYGGSCIIRFNPKGAVDRIIDLPVTNPTSCVFGGPDMTTLYITSAADDTDGSRPLEGAVLAIETGFVGAPCHRFAG
ncbi:SMP-30/gluconolactonase/LRE family protein [Thalassospira sp. TSL5-1]|uniref:SMP-30/gluconolactonase/LRE family protein n=1 Tax=Thalassospira sp. TSL5-1 TaxID=1544451 RepID=UPI00093A9964|nr:SMP-30/gluconolactonase/LRE family protein [Thalassospira sp. TSL5-1]OKH86749.1 gluconolaconase [Thalassospira sp. TSL5-1]